MMCPRCEVVTLAERSRRGVTIDLCPECKGIWLDRGELDRLLVRDSDEDREREPPRARRDAERFDDDDDDDRRRGRRDRRDDDDDDDDGPARGPRGFFGALRSMFD